MVATLVLVAKAPTARLCALAAEVRTAKEGLAYVLHLSLLQGLRHKETERLTVAGEETVSAQSQISDTLDLVAVHRDGVCARVRLCLGVLRALA
jgi:hypothetical protein